MQSSICANWSSRLWMAAGWSNGQKELPTSVHWPIERSTEHSHVITYNSRRIPSLGGGSSPWSSRLSCYWVKWGWPWTDLSEVNDEKSDAVVETPQLSGLSRNASRCPMTKSNIPDNCLKFKHDAKAVSELHKAVYKEQKTKQSKITCSFIKSSVSPSTMLSIVSYHLDNFQPEIPTSFQHTPT